MNFDLTEDEEMLKALAERFVTDRYDAEQRRTYQAEPQGFSKANWSMLAELGLIAAMFSEADGGLGVGRTGLIAMMEALGRGLIVEPLAENVGLAANLLARVAPSDVRDTWLPGLADGSRMVALAHREHAARQTPTWVETKAAATGDGHTLSGAKSMVVAGLGADAYLVTARQSGAVDAADGVAIFLVEANAPGLTTTPWRLADGTYAVALTLNNVPATNLGGSLADLDAAQTAAALLRSAEALGVMEKLFADTLDYLRTRKQFGVALGTFQALQHRMVAQYAMLEQARGLLYLAAMTDDADGNLLEKRIHGARAFIADAAMTLGHEMIQMHGGMGVTDELVIGHGHKRLMVLARWPEDATAALDRYAA